MNSKILILSVILILITNQFTSAQMECRSMLGAHLTPFKKDVPILWGIEGTMAPGIMTSPFADQDATKLNGGMLLAALDFSFLKTSNIYIEGGYKNWQNSDFVKKMDDNFSRHMGVRQAFYSYSGESTKIKLGLHETKLGDFFLIDERVLGASIDKNIGAFTVNLRGGTVTENFARMGKFCANRHLYGIINPSYTENIGKKVGETNLAGIAINWSPHYVKPKETKASSNEFESTDKFESTDEFGATDEFHENHDFNEFGSADEFNDETEPETKQKIKITNIGLVMYSEFGTEAYIPEPKFYTGLLIDMNLPYEFFLQIGSVYQNMLNNNSIVYIAKFGKNITWNNASNTKISGAYIGKSNIDENAIFQPLFSNLFIGEIMRMDATEFPLWQVAIKHRFPGKLKLHIAIKAVAQLENMKTNEQDIELGLMAFKNHIKLTLIGSRVETLALPKEFYMARIEMRVAF